MSTIRLCNNCLEPNAVSVQIGWPRRGSQFDPVTDTVDLCPLCKRDLAAGDFGDLARRYKAERLVKR